MIPTPKPQASRLGCVKCQIDGWEPIRRLTCPKCGVKIVMVLESVWDALIGVSDKTARDVSEKINKTQNKSLLNDYKTPFNSDLTDKSNESV